MSECDHWAHFLAILGLYALVCYLYDNLLSGVLILKSVIEGLVYPERKLDLRKKYGTWAVITGSTDGIGKYYAYELAKKGINIVLVARSKDKLVSCTEEIESQYGVETKWIQADFSMGAEIYDHIEKELEDIPVGILVNNVGCTYGRVDCVTEFPSKVLWNVMNTNVGAATIMCQMMIKKMKANGGKGAIVNVSSATESQPAPYGAIYGASKAYIRSLTHSLQYEVADTNIDIQLLSPFFVVTKINSYSTKIMQGGITIPNAETYSRWAVFTLGRTSQTSGYFFHAFQKAITNLVPYRVRTLVACRIAESLRENQTNSELMTN